MLRITLGKLLEEQTHRSPDAHFVTFVDTGERLSYAEFNERCNRFAHGLAERGVGAGDFVGIMLRNSLEYLVSSYALKKLGAVEVALNIDFRGPGLVRMVNLTQSSMLITSNEFLAPLNQVAGELTHLNTLIVTDAVDSPLPGCEHLAFESVLSSNDENPGVEVRDTDLTIILFTSGTTGLSKGLLLSHRFVMCGATGVVETYGLTEQDCVYTPWPLHHYGAAVCEAPVAIMTGGRLALRSRLSVSRFWQEAREHGATWAMMMGASQKFLWDKEPGPYDKNHGLRFVWGGPFPVDRPAFEERFGLKTGYCYGLSDIGMLSFQSLDTQEPPESCGRVRTELFDVRIVDDDDDEVPIGELGEIVCRPLVPDILLKGYYGLPEYTLETFRNFWFHTGDLGYFDKDGYLFFVQRKKQVIRRSGENILPTEVEEIVHSHPAVEECAVVGVPNELADEDVQVFVVLKPGESLDADELQHYCAQNMAHFMVPRHVRIIDEMPKTSTEKPALGRLLELYP